MPNAGDEVLVVDHLTYYETTVVAVATNYFAYPHAERVERVQMGTNFYDFLPFVRSGRCVSRRLLFGGCSVERSRRVRGSRGMSAAGGGCIRFSSRR